MVITKHPGTGGEVSVGTVTAQLLYEIAGPEYPNTDVVARFDTMALADDGADRVRIAGTLGNPAPEDVKVAHQPAGWLAQHHDLRPHRARHRGQGRPHPRRPGSQARRPGAVRRLRHPAHPHRRPDAPTNAEAAAQLRITVKDGDPERVGRAFSDAATELALAGYPGLHLTSPPTAGAASGSTGRLWCPPTRWSRWWWPPAGPRPRFPILLICPVRAVARARARQWVAARRWRPRRRRPGARLSGSRSEPSSERVGGQGRQCQRRVVGPDRRGLGWLDGYLTDERFRALLPEADGLAVRRYRFPNLRAVNFVVVGLLGEGVASSTRPDPQAKSLGEYLRSRLVDIPVSLLAARPTAQQAKE